MNDKDAKELVRAMKELVRELKAIRRIMQSWDKDPSVGEKDIEEYLL